MESANWYWKVVRQFVSERFCVGLSRGSCLNYLHRLGFAFKRPKKRLLKADAVKREAFLAEYAALSEEAGRNCAKIFFADEAHFRAAHFRADAELRGKWGAERGTGAGGLDQPAVWGEGRLLLGGVSGARRCGLDGTGWQQQLLDLGSLSGTTER